LRENKFVHRSRLAIEPPVSEQGERPTRAGAVADRAGAMAGLDLVHFAKSLNRPLFSRLEISGEATSIACFVHRSNPLVLHPEMKTGRRAYLFP
jgi:hypothetical protein